MLEFVIDEHAVEPCVGCDQCASARWLIEVDRAVGSTTCQDCIGADDPPPSAVRRDADQRSSADADRAELAG
jgi:hypothetical protein